MAEDPKKPDRAKRDAYYDRYGRDPEIKKFRNAAAWQRMSKSVRAEHPVCQRCERVFSAHAHHVLPLDTPEGWEQRLDRKSLLAVCEGCHAQLEAEASARKVPVGPAVRGTLTIVEDDVYRYDPTAAERPIRFIETFCNRTDSGDPLVLLDWQKELIRTLFGWTNRKTGLRRFGELYLLTAKGSGKTPLLTMIGLYLMLGEGKEGVSVISCASDFTQANKLSFGDPTAIEPRVRLRITRRCLGAEEIVKRGRLADDPVLREMRIFRLRFETNYLLTEARAQRLLSLVHHDRSSSQAPPAIHYDGFGDAPKNDPAELQHFARRVRLGQPQFRAILLDLYEGRCAISGWCPASVLEAAHILDHATSGINNPENGLLIRSDLHSLFDEGLLKIDPNSFLVAMDSSLKSTPYWDFNGRPLKPRRDGSHPSQEYLRTRWETTPSRND